MQDVNKTERLKIDEEILIQAESILVNHPGLKENRISARVKEGVVILLGKVDTYKTRTLAKDVLANLPGVAHVRDLLRT